MSYKLQYEGHRFLRDTSIYTPEYILSLNPNGDYFYTFVVDIRCPKEIHDKLNHFPSLREREIEPGTKIKIISATFYNKIQYPISLHVLQYVFKKGINIL